MLTICFVIFDFFPDLDLVETMVSVRNVSLTDKSGMAEVKFGELVAIGISVLLFRLYLYSVLVHMTMKYV